MKELSNMALHLTFGLPRCGWAAHAAECLVVGQLGLPWM